MSVPRVRARVRVRCLGRCTLVIGFQIEIGFDCNMRVSVRLGLRFTNLWGSPLKHSDWSHAPSKSRDRARCSVIGMGSIVLLLH